MAPQTEGSYIDDVVKQEMPGGHSREQVTVLAGAGSSRVLSVGQVLGKQQGLAAAMAADGGNTGNGAAGAVTKGPDLKRGVYRLECVAAAANAGTFKVIDPDGQRLDDLKVGMAYDTSHFDVTIADGATDFIVGDKFTLTVTDGSGKVVALAPAAEDGTEKAYGVLLYAVTALDGVDNPGGVALVRGPATVARQSLVWPGGITAEQKATALAELEAKGIVVRNEA